MAQGRSDDEARPAPGWLEELGVQVADELYAMFQHAAAQEALAMDYGTEVVSAATLIADAAEVEGDGRGLAGEEARRLVRVARAALERVVDADVSELAGLWGGAAKDNPWRVSMAALDARLASLAGSGDG